ncbi:hypothetical protein NMY22_g13397 [Coprinellus aureogranulatus]|nr:hypothetical protein NMY22_g13397 [Coprinellus aureogranulatus]
MEEPAPSSVPAKVNKGKGKAKAPKEKKPTKAQLAAAAAESKAALDRAVLIMGGYEALGMVDPDKAVDTGPRYFFSTPPSPSSLKRKKNKKPKYEFIPLSPSKLDLLEDADCDATADTTDEAAATQGETRSNGDEDKENADPSPAKDGADDVKGQAVEKQGNVVKRKRVISESDVAAAKNACTEKAVAAKNRGRYKLKRLEEDFPTSDMRTLPKIKAKASKVYDTHANIVRSVIPQGFVPIFTKDDFPTQYDLDEARYKALKNSEFAILHSRAKFWVHCAVCKVPNEEGTGEEPLTVILDPHYHYHPGAWNEHIQSEEHLTAVDNHRREELLKLSDYIRILNGSTVECILCSGEWEEEKDGESNQEEKEELEGDGAVEGQDDDEDDEDAGEDNKGIIILDPDYPYHPRAWKEHAESWGHIDNWTTINKSLVVDSK